MRGETLSTPFGGVSLSTHDQDYQWPFSDVGQEKTDTLDSGQTHLMLPFLQFSMYMIQWGRESPESTLIPLLWSWIWGIS